MIHKNKKDLQFYSLLCIIIKNINKEVLSMKLQEIINLDKKYYMNTFGARLPVAFEYGKGCTLYDTDGKSYLDFLAGIAVNVLGYGHPTLTKALTEQIQKLLHCSSLFYIQPQAELAKMLVEYSCGDRVFICNTGAEANEGAIKLARKYFYAKGINKYEIITALNSFHGRTMATLAATGQEKYQKPYKPLPPGFKHVPLNDIDALKNSITDKTCAVMLETIQGEGGIIEVTPQYIEEVAKLCRNNNILLILDEVQTGIGRTGKLFSYQHYEIEPDIITLAKALGGGIPIGAIIAKEPVASAFEPGDHGTTFGGNPLACTAAITVLSTLMEENLIEQCETKGIYFKERLQQLSSKFTFITDVRGKGLMLGLELSDEISGKDVVKNMLNKGFIINVTGHNTLRFVPPLIITKGEIDQLIDALAETFAEIQEEMVVKQEM